MAKTTAQQKPSQKNSPKAHQAPRAAKPTDKRRGIRFEPDPNTLAQIDLDETGAFKPSITGLVAEESYRGCGVVAVMTARLQVGDKIRIQAGKGPVLAAEIRWRAELDSQVIRLGVMYLE